MPRIVLTNRIPAPPQQCFELSLSVHAHTASMNASSERAVGGVTSGPYDSVTRLCLPVI